MKTALITLLFGLESAVHHGVFGKVNAQTLVANKALYIVTVAHINVNVMRASMKKNSDSLALISAL